MERNIENKKYTIDMERNIEKNIEKECYNCKYLEFDTDLCTQFFCKYHEKLIKQDDSCENWLKK